MGSKIYPKVHENPRAFFSSSSPILLELLAHGSGNWSLPREDYIKLVPIVEEFEEILGCPLGGRKPYLFSGFYALHGENSQNGQNLGIRIGPSKTK